MSDKIFYITTPIYYVNGAPHIGSTYTTTAADVIARFKRLQGYKVLFTTGTDENAPKVAEAAEAIGKTPQEFVDDIVKDYLDAWQRMHITYDDFIRTSEPRHQKVVEGVFKKLFESGDIYKDVYQGWYCVSDETFFRKNELIDGMCPNPECKKAVRWVEEENYFFRLSAYADPLLAYIEEHPKFLGPEYRRNEVLSFIKAGLKDMCITRKNYGWGIPVPGDPDKVFYVWFDALLNYLTVAGYLEDDKKFAETWPAEFQLMAKDIFVRFHTTFWPAILMGLELPLPERLYAHGYWTVEGEKMLKSKGNVISPTKVANDLAEISGADIDICIDAIRYYLLREVTFGLDGDFSVSGLIGRFNANLANDLGNLLNRTLPLLHNHRDGTIPTPDIEYNDSKVISDLAVSTADQVAKYLDDLQFSDALGTIWTLVGRANKYMESSAPWKLAKDPECTAKLDTVLYTVLETVRIISILIEPFMPTTASYIWKQLGIEEPLENAKWLDATTWGGLKPGTQTRTQRPIFPRIDTKKVAVEPTPQPAKVKEEKVKQAEQTTISYDQFKTVELLTGKVLTAEKVEGADKLLRLSVDLGTEQRQVVAGIALWYAPEDLVGKTVVVVANLATAKIRGVESRGMLLAATDAEGRAVLLSPDKEVPPGSTVR